MVGALDLRPERQPSGLHLPEQPAPAGVGFRLRQAVALGRKPPQLFGRRNLRGRTVIGCSNTG